MGKVTTNINEPVALFTAISEQGWLYYYFLRELGAVNLSESELI